MNPNVRELQQALLGLGYEPGVVDGEYGPATHRAAMKAIHGELGGNGLTATMGSGIPDSYWPLLAKIESGNRPYVKAASSSASGLYQFIRTTWIGEGGKWGSNPSLAFGGLKPTEAEQTAKARIFTEKNARALRAAGIPVNNASLYASHFLGAGTAIKALKGALTERIAHHVDDGAIAANPSILGGGKTVGDFVQWLERKTGARAK